MHLSLIVLLEAFGSMKKQEFEKTNENKMDLGLLKIKSDLSGKKWDAATKGLSKNNLIKVSVDGDSKVMELVE